MLVVGRPSAFTNAPGPVFRIGLANPLQSLVGGQREKENEEVEGRERRKARVSQALEGKIRAVKQAGAAQLVCLAFASSHRQPLN